MERKAVIVGLIALVAAGVVGAVMWSGDDPRADEAARIAHRAEPPQPDVDGAPPEASASGSSGGSESAPSPRAALGDAGVRRAPRPGVRPPSLNTHGALRQSPEDAARSAGWRLGQTRARIDMVEARVAHLRGAVAEAERGGDAEAAERQRTILRRFETRLSALREEEPALEAEARQDGSLDDVARGMQEGVDGNLPPPPR